MLLRLLCAGRAERQDEDVLRILFVPMPRQNAHKLWMIIRSQDRLDRVVMAEFDDNDWKENLRLSFSKLFGIMENVVKPCDYTVL